MTQVDASSTLSAGTVTYTHPTRGTAWHTNQTCPRCGGPVATNGKVSWCTVCHQGTCPCLIFSRVVGYYAPVSKWNVGKAQEFKDRKNYTLSFDPLTSEPVRSTMEKLKETNRAAET